MQKEKQPFLERIRWEILFLLFITPLIIILLPFFLIVYLLYCMLLNILIWIIWYVRGIHVLYMYSNSPIWKEYIEQNILPRLPPRTIVLNWSDRKKWKFNFTKLVVRHFGGYNDFNPMALVIRPFHNVKVFRFFKPFKELKHGNPESLQKIEAEFFEMLGK